MQYHRELSHPLTLVYGRRCFSLDCLASFRGVTLNSKLRN